jgi:hypothetical protein
MAYLYPPSIIERSSRGERSYDIFSRLLMDRIVFLGAPINDDVASIIIAQLLFLDADNPDKDIHLYINSPGGIVAEGMAIYDTMQHLRAPVGTICMGMAASMGSISVGCGHQGEAECVAPFPHPDPPAFGRGRRGRRRISRSRPGKSCTCEPRWLSSLRYIPARRWRPSKRTWTGTIT